MSRFHFFLLVALAIASLLGPGELRGEARKIVTVFTDRGQRLKGEIDPRTDADWLWLRTVTPRISLRSRTAWARVTSVTHAGRELPKADVLASGQALSNGDVQPAAFPLPAEPEPAVVLPVAAFENCRLERSDFQTVPNVEFVEAHAAVRNFDADPLPDGIELRIVPFGGTEVVPVTGQVSVRLFAEPVQIGSRVRIPRRREWAEEIGRWTVTVRPDDFHRGQAVFRLPFQRIDPLWDRPYAPMGWAQVRLGVNGQGTFRTSIPVVLRDPWRESFAPTAFFPWGHEVNRWGID